MDKTMLFDIDEVIPLSDGIVAVPTLVDEDEDEDVFPAIDKVQCPDCGDMVRDFRQHRCYW